MSNKPHSTESSTARNLTINNLPPSPDLKKMVKNFEKLAKIAKETGFRDSDKPININELGLDFAEELLNFIGQECEIHFEVDKIILDLKESKNANLSTNSEQKKFEMIEGVDYQTLGEDDEYYEENSHLNPFDYQNGVKLSEKGIEKISNRIQQLVSKYKFNDEAKKELFLNNFLNQVLREMNEPSNLAKFLKSALFSESFEFDSEPIQE